MIRFLSLLSIATVVGAYILISTNSTGASIAGAVLIFIGAILGLFLMARAAILRVRDTAREVESTARSVRADFESANTLGDTPSPSGERRFARDPRE